MSENKVARPATPGLDLLDTLTDEVFLAAGASKLAAAGQTPSNREELTEALALGAQVANAVEAKTANEYAVSPMQAHIAKTASLLQGEPTQDQIDQSVNAQIDSNPELAQKFAAVFS